MICQFCQTLIPYAAMKCPGCQRPKPNINPNLSTRVMRGRRGLVVEAYHPYEMSNRRKSPRIEEVTNYMTTQVVENKIMAPGFHDGKELFNGKRSHIGGFNEAFTMEILNDASVARMINNRVTVYQCPKCNNYFPQKRHVRGKQPYISIDHKLSIMDFVMRHASPKEAEIDGHLWSFYYLEDLKKPHLDKSNLQVMCNGCNSSKSGAKNLDTSGPKHEKDRCTNKLCK